MAVSKELLAGLSFWNARSIWNFLINSTYRIHHSSYFKWKKLTRKSHYLSIFCNKA